MVVVVVVEMMGLLLNMIVRRVRMNVIRIVGGLLVAVASIWYIIAASVEINTRNTYVRWIRCGRIERVGMMMLL